MAPRTVHIIGAGLAGLAAAESLTARGVGVHIYEAAPHAGGRCRSLDSATLGMTIDNGNHLMLGANRAVRAYTRAIASSHELAEISPAALPFRDLASGDTWTLWPRRGYDWLAPACAEPQALGAELRAALPLLWARTQPVGPALNAAGPLFQRFWEPVTTAVLNTEPAAADPVLLRRVLAALIAGGEPAARPILARHSLDAALVAPALRTVRRRGAVLHFGERVRGITCRQGRAESLAFADGLQRLGSDEAVIVAVPAREACRLLPALTVPNQTRAILNAHFRLPEPYTGAEPDLLGLVGGTAQWVFRRGALAAVTVSAADPLMGEGGDALLARLWPELRTALDLPADLAQPPGTVLKERRATPAQTPATRSQRPGPDAPGLANLVLAGDWTATGLPATIEGSLRSGRRAATLIRRSPRLRSGSRRRRRGGPRP